MRGFRPIHALCPFPSAGAIARTGRCSHSRTGCVRADTTVFTRVAKIIALASCALLLPDIVLADELAQPSFAGPLQANSHPYSFDGGAIGRIYVGGQVSGIGMLQDNPVSAPHADDAHAIANISNAQVEVQTIEGPWQFYLQLGAYSLPTLGAPYLRANEAVSQYFGPLPVAYLKAVINPEFSVVAGALPTLIGVESNFTFQNINVERGLLWNQEPDISRGIQL